MTNEKNPSIYYDRSTIGSSEELDEYGVWVKSEPQDLSSASMDTQEAFSRDFPQVPKDMEDLADFNLSATEETSPFDDAFSGEDPLLNDDFGFSSEEPEDSIAALPMKFPAEYPAKFPAEDDTGDTSFEEDDFGDDTDAFAGDDIGDFPLDESLLDNPPVKQRAPGPAAPAQGAELSTQLLMKIADELASIKNELSSLKKELHQANIAEDLGEAEEDAGAAGGFFDEEDDEKIALTGDELDNILHTADFIEETGEDATEGLSAEDSRDTPMEDLADSMPVFDPSVFNMSLDDSPDAEDTAGASQDTSLEEAADESAGSMPVFDPSVFNMSLDDSPDAEDTAGASQDTSLEEAADESAGSMPVFDPSVFNMSLDDAPEIALDDSPEIALDDSPEIALDDSPELERLRREGVEPMTPAPAPEDTSYLEEELQENPVEDPLLENISLELDMEDAQDFSTPEEADTGSGNAEDIEDIELSLDDFEDTDISDENIPEEAESPEQDAETAEVLLAADASLEALEEAADVPPEISDDLENNFDALDVDLALPSLEKSTEDDDTFAQVIPEGFVVEAEDALTLDDSLDIEEVPDAAIQLDSIPEIAEAAEAEPVSVPEPTEEPGEAESAEAEDSAAFPDDFALEPSDSGFEVSSEAAKASDVDVSAIPAPIKNELRSVLSYMDQLLESLPEEKIEEFAKSEYFETYKKLFEDLGLV